MQQLVRFRNFCQGTPENIWITVDRLLERMVQMYRWRPNLFHRQNVSVLQEVYRVVTPQSVEPTPHHATVLGVLLLLLLLLLLLRLLLLLLIVGTVGLLKLLLLLLLLLMVMMVLMRKMTMLMGLLLLELLVRMHSRHWGLLLKWLLLLLIWIVAVGLLGCGHRGHGL